ncbi:MAG: hypothetical protein AAB225_15630 [Acidobacteriota bacterium]
MNITVGPPVVDEDFFNREEVIENLWYALQHHSVLLAAPRRVGKSSLMLKLFSEPQAGFEVLWLDGQDYDTPEDLVADLAIKAAKLRSNLNGFVGKLLGIAAKVEELEVWQLKLKLREQLSGSWRLHGETVVRDALKPDTKLLIVIDELPMLLHKLITNRGDSGKVAAQDLLDWLRHLRQAPEFFQQVRQLVGGSIGLTRIASLTGSSHKIADLRPIEVGALERPKAKELATLLLKSRDVALEDGVMETFLDQIGTLLPIFIQIMASVVASEVRRRKQPANAELIRECYEQRALGPEFRLSFEDYYERLNRYYSPEEARVARILLRELAIADGPQAKSTLLGIYQRELGPAADAFKFDLLLTWLSDDFYVEETGEGRVHFKSRWMRDWWRTYHGSRP